MTPERWKRVEELYHAAQVHAPGERSAFLDRECSDDPGLREEVASLLDEQVDDGFLARPAASMKAPVVSAVATAVMTGQRLGAYHLQSLLGAGGMGEVYRSHDTKLGRVEAPGRTSVPSPERNRGGVDRADGHLT